MFQRIFTGTLVAAVLFGGLTAPVISNAQSTGDIQVQINELLAKVRQLTEQLNQLRGGNQVLDAFQPVHTQPPVASLPSRLCPILERGLSFGSQGDDVRSLQAFLQERGLLSVEPTGFFGRLTEQALQKWQASEGVVSSGSAATTGWGRLGPATRARITAWCGNIGGDFVNERHFTASPQAGSAPLTVTFNTWISGFRIPSVSYVIDYGDGATENTTNCNAPADACVSPGQNTHTYAQNGTYVAKLIRKETNTCVPIADTVCAAWVEKEEVLGTATIRVGVNEPVACTMEYRPVCGAKPIVCIKAPCDPIPTTYGNRCMMNADGASLIYEGACRTDAANKPPVVSGLSGPTTLGINETGTWSVSASDPEGGSLSYQVWWGDEMQVSAVSHVLADATEFLQQSTFTHSYARAGTYTVRVVVKDASGQRAETSMTVKVNGSNVVCTEEYAPVCARPSGCANTCQAGMFCTLLCKLHEPQTYSNRCHMNASEAQFLHEGTCTSTSGNIF